MILIISWSWSEDTSLIEYWSYKVVLKTRKFWDIRANCILLFLMKLHASSNMKKSYFSSQSFLFKVQLSVHTRYFISIFLHGERWLFSLTWINFARMISLTVHPKINQGAPRRKVTAPSRLHLANEMSRKLMTQLRSHHWLPPSLRLRSFVISHYCRIVC